MMMMCGSQTQESSRRLPWCHKVLGQGHIGEAKNLRVVSHSKLSSKHLQAHGTIRGSWLSPRPGQRWLISLKIDDISILWQRALWLTACPDPAYLSGHAPGCASSLAFSVDAHCLGSHYSRIHPSQALCTDLSCMQSGRQRNAPGLSIAILHRLLKHRGFPYGMSHFEPQSCLYPRVRVQSLVCVSSNGRLRI